METLRDERNRESQEYREMLRADRASYIARIAACPKAVHDIADDITEVQRKIYYSKDSAQLYRLTTRLSELIEEQHAVQIVNGAIGKEAEAES